MKKRLILILVTAVVGTALALRAVGAPRKANRFSRQENTQQEELLAKGKAIFVDKCAKCHNENGDNELSSGKPLNQRGLSVEAIAKTVNGRLSKGTEEERRALTLYIASFMKKPDKATAKR